MQRVVIRPRIQVAVLLAVFIMFGLLGLLYLTREEVLAGRYTFGAVLGVVCSLTGVGGVWRALRMGVVIDSEGVQVRSFDSRTVVTPWSAVEDIFCARGFDRSEWFGILLGTACIGGCGYMVFAGLRGTASLRRRRGA